MVELVLTTHSDDSARQIWQLRQRERVPPINPPKWGEELWTGVAQPGKWEGIEGEIAQNWRESQKGREIITIQIQLMEMRIEMVARMVV